jgi:hypothetical protein
MAFESHRSYATCSSVTGVGSSIRQTEPPNVCLLRTKDRVPISAFASVRGPARLVVEENPVCELVFELR